MLTSRIGAPIKNTNIFSGLYSLFSRIEIFCSSKYTLVESVTVQVSFEAEVSDPQFGESKLLGTEDSSEF